MYHSSKHVGLIQKIAKNCEQGASSQHNNKEEIITSSRILGEVLTMAQQRYNASGGAFKKRGLHTSIIIITIVVEKLNVRF